MAMTVRSEEYIKHTDVTGTDGVQEVIAEIAVDTIEELPAANGITGKRLHQGSLAFIIKEGKIVVLSGDGKWIDCSGNVVKG